MSKKPAKHISSVKSTIKWSVLLFLSVAIIIVSTILWDYYCLWLYIDIPQMIGLSSNTEQTQYIPSATISAVPTPTSSPSPALSPNTTSSADTSPTDTPVPTPTPHPGDRDGKFVKGRALFSDDTYQSKDLYVHITKFYENEITYFIAEVYCRDMSNFFASFAGGKYGKFTGTTSAQAIENNAIFAVSGDYYNARDGGITIRNSVLYREEKEPYRDTLAIYPDGSMAGFDYHSADVQQFVDDNVVHTYTFGPLLLTDYKEVRNFAETDNTVRHPRCAIGMIEPYHYIFLVADGRRQGYSIGMTIYEVSQIFESYGCEVAYTLDGGGSATMVFMGELVNKPQGTDKERGIGDAICFIETVGN